MSPRRAWDQVQDWLRAPASWIPQPTQAHSDVLGALILRYDLRGNIVSDAALAIEHGLTLCSADTDFARFAELRWVDPLTS